MHQITTVKQAYDAAQRGADVIIAQGGESGGYGGTVATFALVPQVVDAVRPVPVLAAGGISDGRGLAAALMLGAQGVNIGTRFLASLESPIADGYKQMILAADSEDAVKADVWNDIMPLPGAAGYITVPRALRTPFLDEWQQRREDARREQQRLQGEVVAAMQSGRLHELVPFAGQTAGAINDIPPVAEILARLVDEAERVLEGAAGLIAKA
jgi:enoyl-[acyl-carrier protein] reductase II